MSYKELETKYSKYDKTIEKWKKKEHDWEKKEKQYEHDLKSVARLKAEIKVLTESNYQLKEEAVRMTEG